ncbi:MAG: hypothetical protein Q7R76_06900 [Candidatus Woesearchaeota archaeon]|nr:hypothetical protein [Candidatus Woesearchaeota archaeon]
MVPLKDRLSELFPNVRKTFGLDDAVAVGGDNFWHTGVATGTVLPIKGIKRPRSFLWKTPYEITGGGRVDKYEPAEKGEIFVYPETKNTSVKEVLAYLIAIDPAPGLETAFEDISNEALQGLLAHELAEVILARQQPNYHFRITHHGLPEYQVDKIAAQRGYKDQVRAYLNFLMAHVETIRQRPKIRSFFDSLAEMGVTVLDVSPQEPERSVTESCRLELETRLQSLDGTLVQVSSRPVVVAYSV